MPILGPLSIPVWGTRLCLAVLVLLLVSVLGCARCQENAEGLQPTSHSLSAGSTLYNKQQPNCTNNRDSFSPCGNVFGVLSPSSFLHGAVGADHAPELLCCDAAPTDGGSCAAWSRPRRVTALSPPPLRASRSVRRRPQREAPPIGSGAWRTADSCLPRCDSSGVHADVSNHCAYSFSNHARRWAGGADVAPLCCASAQSELGVSACTGSSRHRNFYMQAATGGHGPAVAASAHCHDARGAHSDSHVCAQHVPRSIGTLDALRSSLTPPAIRWMRDSFEAQRAPFSWPVQLLLLLQLAILALIGIVAIRALPSWPDASDRSLANYCRFGGCGPPVLLVVVATLTMLRTASAQSTSAISVAVTAAQCPRPRGVSVDSTTGVVYAACHDGGVINFNGATVTTLATSAQCRDPNDVAFNSATGVVYAACSGNGGGVISINGATVTTLATSAQCANPNAVSINSATGVVYAACSDTGGGGSGGGVISITGATVSMLANSTQCPGASDVAFDSATGVIYAACRFGDVISINGAAVATIATTVQCPNPTGVLLNNATGVVCAACAGNGGGVVSISGATVSTLATYSQCPSASGISFNSVTGGVYAACRSGGVISINGATVTTLATHSQCPGAYSVSFNSATGVAYAGCYNGGVSAVGNVALGVTSTAQCPNPNDVAVNSATGVVYAACSGNGGGVISINGATVTTLATSAQCPTPYAVSINSATGVVYAACTHGRVISINGATITTLATSTQCLNSYGVSFNSATGVVYAACSGNGGGVISINGATVTTLANSTQCPRAYSVFVNSATGVVYSACSGGGGGGGGVISITGATVSMLANSTQCPGAYDVSVNSATGVIYAACWGNGGSVISINGASVTTLATSTQCPNPTSVTINSATGMVYAACSGGGVVGGVVISINRAKITMLASSSQCPTPYAVSINSATGVVHAACSYGGVNSISTAPTCFVGFAYSQGDCLPCAAGTSRNASMVLDGSFVQCSACSFGAVAPLVGSSECSVCAAGKYAASPVLPCTSCPPGFYSSTPAATSCSACPAGSYGAISQLSSAVCSGTCLPGYWCPPGSTSATQITCGSPAVFCARNSTSPTVVPAGMYAAALIGGTDATMSAALPCPAGSYCVSGNRHVCSAGSFQNQTGQSACRECSAGSFTAAFNATECTVCSRGSYIFSQGGTACSACLPGRYANITGAVACTDCAIGTYASSANSIQCTPCEPSTIAAVPGSSFCINCPGGSTSIAGNASACVPCAIGRFSSGGGVDCAACATGMYASQTGRLTCTPCAVGFAASGLNSSQCSPCAAGTFADRTGNAACSVCLPGRYTNITGAAECVGCSAGFVADSGASSCTGCAAGRYAAGVKDCILCSAGTFSSQAAATTCEPCAAGAFASKSNSTQCSPCALGRFTDTTGNTACLSCLPGRHAPANGSTECGACPPQTYASAAGMSACTQCAPFTYAATPGSFFCFPCGLGRQGTVNTTSGAITCEDCQPGFASTDGGTCQPCSPGSYAAASRAVGCSSCTPGRAQPHDTALNCTACPLGRFSNSSGAAYCHACPSGTETLADAASYCSLCPAGYERHPFSVVCTPCPAGWSSFGGTLPCRMVSPGFFVPLPASAFAQPCPVGRYQNASGAVDCIDCPVGAFQAANGSPSCSFCRAGTFGGRLAQEQCDSCAPGRSAASGQASCMVCGPGTFSELAGAVECSLCATGTHQNASAQTACHVCEAGTYSASGASTCTPCSAGEYSSRSRAGQCQQCSVGYAQPAPGSTYCDACDPGNYQPSVGKSSCYPCELGKYAPERAQSNCLPCDTQVTLDRRNCTSNACPRNYEYDQNRGCTVCSLGSSAQSGGECSVCVADFYTPEVGLDCVSCRQSGMEGLTCSNGLASVETGYWAYTVSVPDGLSRIRAEFRAALCPPNTCPGGALQNPSPGNGSQSVILASPCESPRISSPLCGACTDGYVVWGADCARCDGTRAGMVFLCVVLSYAVVLFFLLHDSSSAGFLQILLYFAQTAMLIVGPLATWLGFLSFFNLSPNSTAECLANITPYEQLLLSVLMPVALLLELGSVAIIHKLAQPLLRRAEAWSWLPPRMQNWRQKLCTVNLDRYVACALVLLIFSYTQVSRSCIAYLNCVQAGDVRVVFSSPTMYCESSEYRTNRIVVVLTLLVFIIGFPLGSLLFLRVHRLDVEAAVLLAMTRRKEVGMEAARKERRQPRKSIMQLAVTVPASSASTEAASSPRLSSFLCRFGPLFASYRGTAWWWSSFTLVRRALFTTVDVALVATPATKFMAFTFLNFYTLCGHGLMQPFVSEDLNHAEWASQVMLVTISVLLTANPPPYATPIQVALFLLIVPLTLVLALLVVRQLRPILLRLAMRLHASALAFQRRLNKQPIETDVTKYIPSDLSVDTEQAQDDPGVQMVSSPSQQPLAHVSPKPTQTWVLLNEPPSDLHSSAAVESPLASPSAVQVHPSVESLHAPSRAAVVHRPPQLPPMRGRPRPAATVQYANTTSSAAPPSDLHLPHTVSMHATSPSVPL